MNPCRSRAGCRGTARAVLGPTLCTGGRSRQRIENSFSAPVYTFLSISTCQETETSGLCTGPSSRHRIMSQRNFLTHNLLNNLVCTVRAPETRATDKLPPQSQNHHEFGGPFAAPAGWPAEASWEMMPPHLAADGPAGLSFPFPSPTPCLLPLSTKKA